MQSERVGPCLPTHLPGCLARSQRKGAPALAELLILEQNLLSQQRAVASGALSGQSSVFSSASGKEGGPDCTEGCDHTN